MGVFSDRGLVENRLGVFTRNFPERYFELAKQKCPTLVSKLPFIRQGVRCSIVYANNPFFILSTDSKQVPYSVLRHSIVGTWDESEYPELANANDIDDIIRILELEDVLYHIKLDSLEADYLDSILGEGAAKELAEQLLEENLRTLQPTFEDSVFRMKEAYELLFRLENKLRALIEKKLKEKYGEGDWWTKGTTNTAKKNCERCLQDYRRKWHIIKPASLMDCVDFEDLHDIIVNKNYDLFQECVGPLDRFSANMKSLELPRNLIAHNNVIPTDEYYNFRKTVEILLRVIEPNLV